MAKGVHIEGVDECLKTLDALPERAVKVAKKAMRKGAAAAAKTIKAKIPARYKKLVKSRVGTLPDGNPWARAGLYGASVAQGSKKADLGFQWFKAYWANYGTLSRRDPTHRFANKIKPKSDTRRNNVGQPAQNFFEAATQSGWQEAFFNAFVEEMKKREKELYER